MVHPKGGEIMRRQASSFSEIDHCRRFLNTKRSQGFISNKTWDKIKDAWHQASSDEDRIDLTRSVYRSIAVANGIYPLGYFLD